ncbi:hypothetical protein [Streptomyces decoyicus]
MKLTLARLRNYFAGNPVRVRAALLAVLSLVAPYVPKVTEFAGNELVVGGLVAAVAILLGETGQRKEDAKTAEAAASAQTE